MWDYIKMLFKKWSCQHSWERLVTTYERRQYSETTCVVCTCSHCGKLRRLNLEGKEVETRFTGPSFGSKPVEKWKN